METIIKYNRPKNTNNRGQNNVTIINNGGGGSNSSDIDFSNIDNYLHWKKSVGQFSLVPRESYNQAEGDNSVAIGEYTQTINNGELAIGMFNKPQSGETYFTIGNGTDDVNRSNLFSVGSANTVVNNHLSGKTAYFSTNITSPNVSGNNGSFTNATIVNAHTSGLTANTVNVDNKLTTNQLQAVSGYIKTLLSDEITVDYLTVTKAAHFFKLIIDEIKATQGQILITPANAVIDKVESVNGNYRCYFRAKDEDKEIYNNFEVNDQVVCQTFNAASGTSYDVTNTYYWRLCVGTGTTTTDISGETLECHYIDLSDSDKDQYTISAPSQGDNVVLLGNRTDTTRQAAIIISAYNSEFLDKGIKAPSIVQYFGINDYNLSAHRRNVISRDFNEFKGSFKTSTGADIEELIEDVASGTTAYVHTAWANSADGSVDFTKDARGGSYSYIGFCSNNTESDENLIYSDYTWNYCKGTNGQNAEFYRLVPIIEKAIVDKNSTLGVQFQYQIVHVSGNSVTTVTASTSGYWVRVKPNNSSTYYNLSTNTTTPNYTNASFITNYHKQTSKPTYFTVYLVSGSSAVVKDQKTVSVIFDASATLEVTDEINATVQGHSETISSHTNSITTLNQNYNSISSTVSAHTTSINNLNNELDDLNIGARNLVMNGAFKKGFNYWQDWGTPTTRQITTSYKEKWLYLETTSNLWEGVSQSHYSDYGITIEPNETYTVSFRARALANTATTVCAGFHWFSGTTDTIRDQHWYTFNVNSTTAKRYSATFTVPSGMNHFNIMIGDNTTKVQKFYITDIKLEKGNKPTDWTPSIEETESELSTVSGQVVTNTSNISSLQQTATGLTSTVNSHTTSINTLNNQVTANTNNISQIQQTSTQISSRVETIENNYISDVDFAKTVTIDATALDSSKCYPVAIAFQTDASGGQYNGSDVIRCKVNRTLNRSYGVPSYSEHNDGFVCSLDWNTKASAWGTNIVNENWYNGDTTRFINDYKVNWAKENNIIGSIGQSYRVSTEIVYVRGGSKYDVSTSHKYSDIVLYSTGYTCDYGTGTETRPVINASDLVIPIQDSRTYSEILQTANNIQLNVYNELKQKTGIDVSDGSITLDADNTTVVGNLNLTDTENGLTVYDSDKIGRVYLQPDSINSFSGETINGTMQYSSTTISKTGYTTCTATLNKLSLGYRTPYYELNINNFAVTQYSTYYSTTYNRAPSGITVTIYKDSTLKTSKTFALYASGNSYDKSMHNTSDTFTYTFKESGYYYLEYKVLNEQQTQPTYYTMSTSVNAQIQFGAKVKTYIGKNGLFCHSGANKHLWVNEDKIELRNDLSGFRLNSSNNKSSFNFGNLEVLASVSGVAPNVKPVWLPFWNYTPTFEPEGYTYSKINNINEYKYLTQIDPCKQSGLCIINIPATDSSHNYQETWVMLPPLTNVDADGRTFNLPVGYTVTIINNMTDNVRDLYIVPNVSSQNAGKIIDANRDLNIFSSLNGSQSSDTFIYMGTWSDGTQNVMYWRQMHDPQ